MPQIVISYRREDSGAITGRIFDRLVARYGRDAVFRDIDNIPIGVDFRAHLDQVLAASDVVVAVIGAQWMGPPASPSRLANAADPVRLEIEAALRKGAPLIPVLVSGAAMPTTSQLPESLKDFAYRNAVQLDAGQDFDVHMSRLLGAMDRILGTAAETARASVGGTAATLAPPAPPKRHRLLIGASVVAALAIALTAGWYVVVERQKSPPPTDIAAVPPNVPPPPAVSPPSTPTAPIAAAPAPPSIDPEMLFWQAISASNTAADFAEYLRKYPQGQFTGLARNRLAALIPRETPSPEPSIAAASPPAPAKCGGNSDEQVIRPVKLLYEAVNTKNIDLYAALWSDDATYRSTSSGRVRSKAEKIADRRSTFASWERVDLSMDRVAILQRASDRATIQVTYSMMVKFYGRPARTQTGVGERYEVVCGREGNWLIRENIDDG